MFISRTTTSSARAHKNTPRGPTVEPRTLTARNRPTQGQTPASWPSPFDACILCYRTVLKDPKLVCTKCELVHWCCKDHKLEDSKHRDLCLWLLDEEESSKRPSTALAVKTADATIRRKKQMAVLFWTRQSLCPTAQYFAGCCFGLGEGVNRVDMNMSIAHLRIAAGKGHAEASYQLGLCHDKGWGVEIDKRESMRYFKLSVDKGSHCEAMVQLGLCYENGYGGAYINKKEALRLYRLAAQLSLARCFGARDRGNVNLTFLNESIRYLSLASRSQSQLREDDEKSAPA
jgi:hypothetical protein